MAQLLAIEGIDGAGKGTLARALKDHGEAQGCRTALLSFPRYQQTAFAQLIADYLNGAFGDLDKVPVQFAALLYAGDRFESRDHLQQLRAENELVILDRYVMSNVAYNAAKVPADKQPALIDWILRTEFEVFQLPRPDLTCLIATEPELADQRVALKAARDYTAETRDLHEADRPYMARVAAVYRQLAARDDDNQWTILAPQDETGRQYSPEALAATLWQAMPAAL